MRPLKEKIEIGNAFNSNLKASFNNQEASIKSLILVNHLQEKEFHIFNETLLRNGQVTGVPLLEINQESLKSLLWIYEKKNTLKSESLIFSTSIKNQVNISISYSLNWLNQLVINYITQPFIDISLNISHPLSFYLRNIQDYEDFLKKNMIYSYQYIHKEEISANCFKYYYWNKFSNQSLKSNKIISIKDIYSFDMWSNFNSFEIEVNKNQIILQSNNFFNNNIKENKFKRSNFVMLKNRKSIFTIIYDFNINFTKNQDLI